MTSTVHSRYIVVSFPQTTQKRRPISRPKGRGMGHLLWFHNLNKVVALFHLYCVQYRAIFHCDISRVYGTEWRPNLEITKDTEMESSSCQWNFHYWIQQNLQKLQHCCQSGNLWCCPCDENFVNTTFQFQCCPGWAIGCLVWGNRK